jgi:hypothetical protein
MSSFEIQTMLGRVAGEAGRSAGTGAGTWLAVLPEIVSATMTTGRYASFMMVVGAILRPAVPL